MPQTTAAPAASDETPTPKKTAAGFKVRVPDDTGSTVTLTGHYGAVTYDVRGDVITTATLDEAIRLASTIEGATLVTKEK